MDYIEDIKNEKGNNSQIEVNDYYTTRDNFLRLYYPEKLRKIDQKNSKTTLDLKNKNPNIVQKTSITTKYFKDKNKLESTKKSLCN